MERLRRLVVALLVSTVVMPAAPTPASAFDGFGATEADSTFGTEVVFRATLEGAAPDRLELLLRFGDDPGSTFVAPVVASGGRAEWRWDAARNHLTPNTPIRYQWRAHHGDQAVLSGEGLIVYDDDRPGLDWESRRIGEATVHWYGDAEAQALRFGELSAEGARAAEELLGHELAGPIDIFVYRQRDEFFGALGPGAREWTGAAAFPALRTVFMWIEGGNRSYLERALVHEVTHVVFHDATDNPYHAPPKWLNEGIAVWSELGGAAEERARVEFEARGGGLLAFDAIADQFPIDERRAVLAYAQGATMVDRIIREHGPEAIARIAAAYREGATDDEALLAGTGRSADELMADFFAEFGVEVPQPVEPEPLLPSEVALPPSGGAPHAPPATPPPGESAPRVDPVETRAPLAVIGLAALLVVGLAAGLLARRRRRQGRVSE